MFNEIKLLVEKKEKEILSTNIQTDLRKIKLIKDLLNDEQCFFKIDMNTALSILSFIGIKEQEIKSIYLKLIDPRNFKMNDNVRRITNK